MDAYGDFGIFIIDENDSLIAGNQRWSVIMEAGHKKRQADVTIEIMHISNIRPYGKNPRKNSKAIRIQPFSYKPAVKTVF